MKRDGRQRFFDAVRALDEKDREENKRRVACWEMGNIVGSLSFAILSHFSAFVNRNVMDFRCISRNESMNRALTNVYDQSPPFPYCNCAKGSQQWSKTRTDHSESSLHYVTATDEQVDGGGSGTEG